MSGGSFQYAYHHVDGFANDLEHVLARQGKPDDWGGTHSAYSPATNIAMRLLVAEARHLARQMHAVEWLCSGDINEEEFLKRTLNQGERE